MGRRESDALGGEEPVSLLGLLPEQVERRQRLVEWLTRSPAEVARAARVTPDDLGKWAARLNELVDGESFFVDYWGAASSAP